MMKPLRLRLIVLGVGVLQRQRCGEIQYGYRMSGGFGGSVDQLMLLQVPGNTVCQLLDWGLLGMDASMSTLRVPGLRVPVQPAGVHRTEW